MLIHALRLSGDHQGPCRVHVPSMHRRRRIERRPVRDRRILGRQVDAVALLRHEVPVAEQNEKMTLLSETPLETRP